MAQIDITLLILIGFAIIISFIQFRTKAQLVVPIYICQMLLAATITLIFIMTAETMGISKAILGVFASLFIMTPFYSYKKRFKNQDQLNKHRRVNELAYKLRWFHLVSGIIFLALALYNITINVYPVRGVGTYILIAIFLIPAAYWKFSRHWTQPAKNYEIIE